MSDQLLDTLRALQTAEKREALQSGRGQMHVTIFHGSGNCTEQNYIRRVFTRLLAQAGLREIRLHDIRNI